MSVNLDVGAIVPAHNEGPNLRVSCPSFGLSWTASGSSPRSSVVVVRDVEAHAQEAVGSGLGTIVQWREPGYGGALQRRRHRLATDLLEGGADTRRRLRLEPDPGRSPSRQRRSGRGGGHTGVPKGTAERLRPWRAASSRRQLLVAFRLGRRLESFA